MHFDKLYVVSDLHLGGSQGNQIFRQGPLLAGLIDLVGGLVDDQVALVLNGDIFDFLAEKDATYLNHEYASQMLRDISEREAFAPVFEALTRFLEGEGNTLVVVVGNHDIELALPGVRATLLDLFCGEVGTERSAERRGRVLLAVDGVGFRCRVGRRNVYIVHGEQSDAWNIVDHDALRKVGRALLRGEVPPEWVPNGGTRLVLDAMNRVKSKYPIIDLLKPEREAAIPIVLSFDPSQANAVALEKAARAWGRKAIDRVRSFWMSGDEEGDEQNALDAILRDHFDGAQEHGDLRSIAANHDDRDPIELLDPSEADEMLGVGGFLWRRFRGTSAEEAVRLAIRKRMQADQSFELDYPDEPGEWSKDNLGPDVDFFVAGHTHLRRAMVVNHTAYFNSGTWIALIKLTPHEVEDIAGWPELYEKLKADTIDQLHERGVLDYEPTVVCIERLESGETEGCLADVVRTSGKIVLERLHASRIRR